MIEYIIVLAVISEQVSEEKKAEYILSKMFRIVRTVYNGQPQRVWIFFFLWGFFLFSEEIRLNP